MNPFAVFSLPESFAVDERALEQTYFSLQRQFHPDRNPGIDAAQRSMDVNQAYAILKNPLKRAQALLALRGIIVNGERDTVQPDASLLMEVMSLREAVEEGEDISTLLQTRQQEGIAELTAFFSQEDWTNAAQAAIRLQYLSKIAQELRLKHTP